VVVAVILGQALVFVTPGAAGVEERTRAAAAYLAWNGVEDIEQPVE
jgi:hypothetical protein